MSTTDALLAVDEALASGRPDATDPLDRELQEIALALRADSPAPDPSFARELDERVERRFAKPRVARSLLPRRRLVLAGMASLLMVVAIGGAVAGLSGRDEPRALPTPSSATGSTGVAPPESLVAPAPAGATAADATKRMSQFSTAGGLGERAPVVPGPRRVERDARLTLAAPAGDLDHVADQVVDVTDRHRGVVLDSDLSTGADSSKGGTFTLRVPASELSQTLRDLSRLGEVRARSQSGHDVTRSYDTLGERLNAARIERRGLLRRLSHATSPSDADALRSRLDRLAQEIQGLRRELGQLQNRTSYTRIAVTLVERRGAASPLGGTGDALRGSLRALVGALAITLRVLAAVLPFALLAALAWFGTAALRRRRREAVLS
jgi:hypothetical protein